MTNHNIAKALTESAKLKEALAQKIERVAAAKADTFHAEALDRSLKLVKGGNLATHEGVQELINKRDAWRQAGESLIGRIRNLDKHGELPDEAAFNAELLTVVHEIQSAMEARAKENALWVCAPDPRCNHPAHEYANEALRLSHAAQIVGELLALAQKSE